MLSSQICRPSDMTVTLTVVDSCFRCIYLHVSEIENCFNFIDSNKKQLHTTTFNAGFLNAKCNGNGSMLSEHNDLSCYTVCSCFICNHSARFSCGYPDLRRCIDPPGRSVVTCSEQSSAGGVLMGLPFP